jgi:predicted HNH restriction endonuclease
MANIKGKELEIQFHKDMLNIYEKAKNIGYNASRFKQMVANQGGLVVAKKFIGNNIPSDGFTSLWKLGRLDLTVEALVLREDYESLFNEDERQIVRDRLKEYGFEVDESRLIFPKLEPVHRSREYQAHNESIRSKVVFEYLFNSRTHRWLDENVIGLIPSESRGYQSMGVLHHIGLKDKHKGIFNGYSLQEAITLLQNQSNEFNRVVDCLDNLNTLENQNYGLDEEIESLVTEKVDFQLLLNNRGFNYSTFEKELNKKKFAIGKKTMYYILVVKKEPSRVMQTNLIKYIVYVLEDFEIREKNEIYSIEKKNILTDAKREGVKILHKINPVVNINDVTMVHYKQDRPNSNPWQKDSYQDLSELFFEYTKLNITSLNISIDDIESELAEEDEYHKDGKTSYYHGKRYERNPQNRAKAIEIHGLNCVCCGFNFEEVYGERGKDFIEVHHVNPLSTLQEEVVINPVTDLVPVCSNCHRMMHRRKDEVLSVEELKAILDEKKRVSL